MLTHRPTLRRFAFFLLTTLVAAESTTDAALLAGAAKVEITDKEAGPVNDPLYARALVLKTESTTVAIISVDAVAIGEIGPIGNDYLPSIRKQLNAELGISPDRVLVNASHCHGIVCKEADERTVQAVRLAWKRLQPVHVGSGTGHENRIMENRRLLLHTGVEADVRHAYALPPDEEVKAIGPVDPEIGVVRLDRPDGSTLAVIFNFACHPIQGVPGGHNTADITGFASKVIEDNLSEGTVALFLQGCGGDINPVYYKDVDHPRHAEPLGNMLGLSTLQAVRDIKPRDDDRLAVLHELLTLPRANRKDRIAELEARQQQLTASLRGTSLNLKSFVNLVIKYNLSVKFPSYHSHGYMHQHAIGQTDLQHLDEENRRNIQAYIRNIHTMEDLTRVQTNLRLLKKHQADLEASGRETIDVEVLALRLGDMVLATFPGELTVRIGLNIKKRSPHAHTFVAGYTNGYIYYAPTAEQLKNAGRAQEDSDCILAPEWQKIFEDKVQAMLKAL